MVIDWNEVQNFSSNIVFGILLFALILYWVNLSLFNDSDLLTKVGRFSTITASIILFFILCSRWIVASYFPLSNLYESLLFLTWFLTFILVIGEQSTKNTIFGAIISPITLMLISFVTLVLPSAMQKINPLVPALQSNWLMMHVTMMLASYADLLVGTLLSSLYLAISGIFKTKLLTNTLIETDTASKVIEEQSLRLYCMELLDLWSYRLITFGFPILTIGIISGAVWANEAWGSYWSWDPKETWALITWLVFATYLHARITKGWEGKKTAILGGLGFFVIWICYLGVNFLGKGLHSYGWLS